MNRVKTFFLAGVFAIASTAAFSQNHRSTESMAPSASKSAAAESIPLKDVTQRSAMLPEASVRASRSAPPKLDEAGFGVSTWTADGKVETSPAPASVIEALKTMAPSAPSQAPAERAKPGKLDPAGIEPISASGDKQSRLISGQDEREQIRDTTRYPFSTVIYLLTEFPDGSRKGCAGTMIGPNHAITAANCVFDTKTNAWPQSVAVYPGLNGENAPFGSYYVVGLSIADGFSKAPKGSYDFDRLLYDIAVVRFEEAVGNKTGWLAIGFDDGMQQTIGNIVGYPADKEFTMWGTACEVDPKQIEPNLFAHLCDIQGTGGAALYQYFQDSDSRTIYGVQAADNDQANYAVRITGPWFDWILAARDGQ